MDDSKDNENENKVEELSEEEIETFEQGEALETFKPADESHSFDARDGEEEIEETFETDFDDDEMAYVTEMEDAPPGFFSKIFKPAFLSVGVLGILLVVLIILFLFMPRGTDVAVRKDMAQLEKRLADIEGYIGALQETLSKKEPAGSADMIDNQTKERIDTLEKVLAAETAGLKKEVNALAAAVNDIEGMMATARAASGRPVIKETAIEKPKVKKPVVTKAVVKKPADSKEVTYYTVKAGDNLYRIALNHGFTEGELLKLNGLKKNAVIHPGDKLKVSR